MDGQMGRWTSAWRKGELATLKKTARYLKFLPGVWLFSVMFSKRF